MPKIPKWLQNYFKVSDLESIRSLVEQIELKTQAELVPIVVRSSIDLPLFRGLLIAIGFSLTLIISPLLQAQLSWNSPLSIEFVYIGLLAIFSLIAVVASSNPFIIKCFFNKSHIQNLVFRRACSEFFETQLHQSDSRTAVLFLYSVLERKAIVIADPNLHSLPQQIWQTAVDKMSVAAKKKQFLLGFKDAFEFVAAELATRLPPQKINRNELSDSIIIKN